MTWTLNELLKIKNIDYLIAFVGYLVISLFVLGGIMLSPGTVGFFHDWFIGPFYEMNKYWASNGLYVWDSQIGNKVYGTDWIFRIIFLPFPALEGELLSKGLLVFIVTLSGFGSYCLGRKLKLSPYISFAAGIFYVFSPIVYTRIVAGHLYYLIAYFLSPLIVWAFFNGREKNKIKYFIIAGLLLSVAVIQLQFLVMMFLVLIILAFIDIKRLKTSMIGMSIVYTVTFLMTLSPILLSQLIVENNQMPFNPIQLLSYHGLVKASNLAESFRMLGYENQPYSYLNLGTSADLFPENSGIMPDWIFYLDFILPIMGFSVLFFRRDKYVISFVVISIVGLFLLKGLNPPFPGIFEFLFKNGFYIFREVWHLAFLYGFSLTFLMALFMERVRRLNFRPSFKVIVCTALISIIVISNGYPLLLGNFAGYLQTYEFPDEYRSLYNNLLSNPDYNVLILPYVNPIRYENLDLEGLDPLVTHSPAMILPTILGNRASPTLSFSTWLLSTIQENKTQDIGNLLSGFGIKYVILRKDSVSNYPDYTPLGSIPSFREKWHNELQPILDSQNDLKIISNTSEYNVYENTNDVKKFFTTRTSIGGLSNFDSLLLISNITSLHNVAAHPLLSDMDSIILIDNKNETSMPLNEFVGLGKYSGELDPASGWADNKVSFGYDSLLASRVSDGIFSASSNSSFNVELQQKYSNKPAEVWVKSLSWNQGGSIKIGINGEEHTLSLFSHNRSFGLSKIFEGQSVEPYQISFRNMHGNNYVEGIYIREKTFEPLNIVNRTFLNPVEAQNETNLVMNSDFSLSNNESGLPSYWYDFHNHCKVSYTCEINGTDGWDNEQSFQISTFNKSNQTWSSIYGREIDVVPHNRYEAVTHMKLNEWAVDSHIALEGFNQSSKSWYQITQCPGGTDGPMGWNLFNCQFEMPEHTTKIRPVLKAGWSSSPIEKATSWFDAFYINSLTVENDYTDVREIKKLMVPEIVNDGLSSNMSSMKETMEFRKVSPTHWNLRISTLEPTMVGFAEPYDGKWEASIYKNGNKIDQVGSLPLYGTINGFWIKQTGDLDITINFVPQKWYDLGLIISLSTFIVCIFYIIIDWIKNKRIKTPDPSFQDHH